MTNATGFYYSNDDTFFGEPQFATDLRAAYDAEQLSDPSYSEYVEFEAYTAAWVWVDAEEAGDYVSDSMYCFEDDILELINS